MALAFPISLTELAHHIGAILVGDDAQISTLASLKEAQAGSLSFYADPRYKKYLQGCEATAVLLSEAMDDRPYAQLLVDNPEATFFELAEAIEAKPRFSPGIDASAVVHKGASVSATAHIGPMVVVEDGAVVGAGAVVCAQSYVGHDCRVGENVMVHVGVKILAGSIIGARSTLYAGAVIGARGFGYRWDGQRHRPEPQLGRVRLGEDVEIGANACVDRAALGETVINEGVRLDNLVQVGHGVHIGAHAVIAAQSGLAGSAVIGRQVMMGGQVGVADHGSVGAHAMVAAQSGVAAKVAEKQIVAGTPAMPLGQWKRAMIALKRLPGLLVEVRALKQRLTDLEKLSKSAEL